MTVERYKGAAPLKRPEDLGRLVALGGFVVAAPLWADPIGTQRSAIEDSYTYYIKPEKARWANGEEISEKERMDISAGNLLLALPDILVYRQSQVGLAEQTIKENEGNPWLGPTLLSLANVGLIESETNRIPADFRQFGSLLDAIARSCQAQDRADRQPLRTAFQWAPSEAAFRRSLRQTTREILAIAAKTDGKAPTVADMSDEWRHTDTPITRPASEKPAYMVWSNWSKTSPYKILNAANAGQYLNRMLLDIEKVSKNLRQR